MSAVVWSSTSRERVSCAGTPCASGWRAGAMTSSQTGCCVSSATETPMPALAAGRFAAGAAGRARSRSSAARSRAASEASTPTGPRGSRPRPAPASRAPRTRAPSPRDGPVDHPRKAQAGDLVERRVGSRAGRDASRELVGEDTGVRAPLRGRPARHSARSMRAARAASVEEHVDCRRVTQSPSELAVTKDVASSCPRRKSIKTSVSTRIGRDMVQSRAHPRRSASGSGRAPGRAGSRPPPGVPLPVGFGSPAP